MDLIFNSETSMNCVTGACPNTYSLGTASWYISSLISFILSVYCGMNVFYPTDGYDRMCDGNLTFDFIVVGAGSAGCAVANRLSEIKSWNVLLIEAGDDPPVESAIPLFDGALQNTRFTWNYSYAKTNSSCLGSEDGTCVFTKGRTLGGSSSVNYMAYVRGNRENFDGWANAGCTGWDYDSVIPYFKKMENFAAKTPNPEIHGYDGPIGVEQYLVSDVTNNPAIYDKVVDVAREFNLTFIEDLTSNTRCGITSIWHTSSNGIRTSAASGYLAPLKNRQNVILLKNTLVSRVILEAYRAVGVEIRREDGTTDRVTCTKEIILSAGSIGTPQILMLSGIGPSDHLTNFGINVTKNLPVGYNLQDHMHFMGLLAPLNMSVKSQNFNDRYYNYLAHRYIQDNEVTNLMMFANTSNSEYTYPDSVYYWYPYQSNSGSLQAYFQSYLINESITNQINEVFSDQSFMNCIPTVLQPFSTGRVTLSGVNISDTPIIESGFFSDNRDVVTAVNLIKYVKKLFASNSYGNATMWMPKLPQCSNLEANSDELYECFCRTMVVTAYHQVGTCKMGAKNDSTAVVDPNCKVIGIQNLTVADGSIMPRVVSANTNVACIMIGEKVSDIIKKSYGQLNV